jgi:hypothetical protein
LLVSVKLLLQSFKQTPVQAKLAVPIAPAIASHCVSLSEKGRAVRCFHRAGKMP